MNFTEPMEISTLALLALVAGRALQWYLRESKKVEFCLLFSSKLMLTMANTRMNARYGFDPRRGESTYAQVALLAGHIFKPNMYNI
mmetsp:Transcript_23940/g.51700  ORF Transcript_23940/g.51700 Transcript_23940/m.51700 type:complete len:86 (-) Transcript_23940:130-387(-)